ncbi:DEAD/DEAH box helicase [Rhodopseudomonas boonkerdii]|uniref:DEAD/DEAH box helicase n=1 Tax=Rhodopseudomonas boonkerdii TaxID=475937 RepID=UPI001E3A9E74|nr:DEAD/DEAH box helicase [Rhodopseudomonas boonkerdii]UGV25989.1 DEAD/DEAH box helicase [Rhodopseudomonas boonkerdii]
MSNFSLRSWQIEALALWEGAGNRGIVEVVTGGGKTIFALSCIRHLKIDTTLVIVPTVALLDQWWEEAASFFGISLDDINLVASSGRIRSGTVNLAVLNSASKLDLRNVTQPYFLIVDECHKAASKKFRAALEGRPIATLGLSATPERPYDEGLEEVLIPKLGNIIFRYTYKDALRDQVIVPFELRNVIFDLEPERQAEYDKLTKAIGRAYSSDAEDERTIALLLKRARVLNLSVNRIRLALRLVLAHKGYRTIIFHEDIEACNVIQEVLSEAKLRSGVYHSKMKLRQRAEVLSAYRQGELDVLITCRALDEGFNVPETEIGIIAASTATRRQRIQRLGRVLRPVKGKSAATVYSLVATEPEIARLRSEERELEGVAVVNWSRA